MPRPAQDDDAGAVRRNGWRQGSVARSDLIAALRERGHEPPNDESCLVLVSHDCDVVNPSFGKEPFVEGLWAQPVANLDGNLTRGKNSRLLHLEGPIKDSPAIELAPGNRFSLDRRLLESYTPAGELEPQQKRLLGTWLAKRYDRTALPDAFNRRLPQKPMKRTLARGGDHINALFVGLEGGELDDNTAYEIVIRATMTVSDFEKSELRAQAQACLDELVGHLGQATGIEVVSEALVSESEITLDDLRTLRPWDFDWMSVPESD